MKVEITYREGSSTWKELIRASNVKDSRKITSARNPSIKIVASNPMAEKKH